MSSWNKLRVLRVFLCYVYAGAVDHVRCFLNSGPVPDIVFVQDGDKRTIINQTLYDQLMKEAQS